MSDLAEQARALWDDNFSSLRSGDHPRVRAAFFAIETALTERIVAVGESGLLRRVVDEAVQPDGYVSGSYFSEVLSVVEALSGSYVSEWDRLPRETQLKVSGVNWGLASRQPRPFPVVVSYSNFVGKDEEFPLYRFLPGPGYLGFSDDNAGELLGFFRTVRHWLKLFRTVNVSGICQCTNGCQAEATTIYGHDSGVYDESYYSVADGERTDYDPVNEDYDVFDKNNEDTPWHLVGDPSTYWSELSSCSYGVGSSAYVFSGGYTRSSRHDTSSDGTKYFGVPTECQYDDRLGRCVCDHSDFKLDEADSSRGYSGQDVHDVTLVTQSDRDDRDSFAQFWRVVEVPNPSILDGVARTAACDDYYYAEVSDPGKLERVPFQVDVRSDSTVDDVFSEVWQYPIFSCDKAVSVSVGTYSTFDFWSDSLEFVFPAAISEIWYGPCGEVKVAREEFTYTEPLDVDPYYNTSNHFQFEETRTSGLVALDTCELVSERTEEYSPVLSGGGDGCYWPLSGENVVRYGLSVSGDCGSRWRGLVVSGNTAVSHSVNDIPEPAYGKLGQGVWPIAFGTPAGDGTYTEFVYSLTDPAMSVILIDYHDSFTFK